MRHLYKVLNDYSPTKWITKSLTKQTRPSSHPLVKLIARDVELLTCREIKGQSLVPSCVPRLVQTGGLIPSLLSKFLCYGILTYLLKKFKPFFCNGNCTFKVVWFDISSAKFLLHFALQTITIYIFMTFFFFFFSDGLFEVGTDSFIPRWWKNLSITICQCPNC